MEMFDFFKKIFSTKTPDIPLIPIDSGLEIEVTGGSDAGRTFPLDHTHILLGRLTEVAVLFSDNTVSRRQAVLEWDPGIKCYIIKNERQAANPTRVNGEPVEKRPLAEGDEVRFGTVILRVQRRQEKVRSSPVLAQDQIVSEVWMNTGYFLTVKDGPDKGKRFDLRKEKILIRRHEGGEATGDILLSDRAISSLQASLEWKEDLKTFEIVHSPEARNATVVFRDDSGKEMEFELQADSPLTLQKGDFIRMGRTYLSYAWEDVREKVRNLRREGSLSPSAGKAGAFGRGVEAVSSPLPPEEGEMPDYSEEPTKKK